MKPTQDGEEVLVKSVGHFMELLKIIDHPPSPSPVRLDNEQSSTTTKKINLRASTKTKSNQRKQNGNKRRNRSFESGSPIATNEGTKQKTKSSKMECDDGTMTLN